MKKEFDNVKRQRYYGLRKGDIVDLKGLNGLVCHANAEVVEYGLMNNNKVVVRLMNGNECEWVAEWCNVVVKVENRQPKGMNSDLKNADFRKYYDTLQKRNYWVLGYFGGGAVNVVNAYRLAQEYSLTCRVPLETVKIDEVLHSQRFKGFKYLYSDAEQEVCKDVKKSDMMIAVMNWLWD